MVVILPQTIKWDKSEMSPKMARAFTSLPNLNLCPRSLQISPCEVSTHPHFPSTPGSRDFSALALEASAI